MYLSFSNFVLWAVYPSMVITPGGMHLHYMTQLAGKERISTTIKINETNIHLTLLGYFYR